MTIAEARHIASIVKELAAKGIDIRQGPRPEQLRGQLLAWGSDWVPGITGVPETMVSVNLDAANLDASAESLKNQPRNALVFTDTECDGLQAVVRYGEPVKFRVGKSVLGNYPDVSVDEARTRAKAILALIAQGVTLG